MAARPAIALSLAAALGGAARAQEPASIQLAVLPPVVDLARGLVAGQTLSFVRDELAVPAACFDRVGVANLNLQVPVDDVTATLHEGTLDLAVDFGTISGRDWALFGRDPADDDLCNDLDARLRWLELRDGRFTTTVRLAAVDGAPVVELVGTPVLSGDLDMDLEWAPSWAADWGWDLWPDDLVLWLFEDELLALVGQAAAARVPPLVHEHLATAELKTTVGDLAIDLGITELHARPEGLQVGAIVDLDWQGRTPCTLDLAGGPPGGADPDLALVPGLGQEAVSVGVTEAFLNRLAWRAWADGLFCLSGEDIGAMVAELVPEVDPAAAGLRAEVGLGSPPVVDISAGAVGLALSRLRLQLSARHEGRTVTLLDLEADAGVQARLEVDDVLASLLVSVDTAWFEVRSLETEHLLSDAPDAQAHFVSFLERWLPELLQARVQRLPTVGRVVRFDALPVAIWLDGLAVEPGGLVTRVSLVHEGDARVDAVAPETTAEIVGASATAVTVATTCSDDESAACAVRWRLDDGPWSTWTDETELDVPVGDDRIHTVEVVARDGWLNEDPTPARVRFDLQAEQRRLGVAGCAVGGGGGGGLGLLGLLGLVGLMFRRRAPHE